MASSTNSQWDNQVIDKNDDTVKDNQNSNPQLDGQVIDKNDDTVKDDQNSEFSQLETLKGFNKLPLEIREMIWEGAFIGVAKKRMFFFDHRGILRNAHRFTDPSRSKAVLNLRLSCYEANRAILRILKAKYDLTMLEFTKLGDLWPNSRATTCLSFPRDFEASTKHDVFYLSSGVVKNRIGNLSSSRYALSASLPWKDTAAAQCPSNLMIDLRTMETLLHDVTTINNPGLIRNGVYGFLAILCIFPPMNQLRFPHDVDRMDWEGMRDPVLRKITVLLYSKMEDMSGDFEYENLVIRPCNGREDYPSILSLAKNNNQKKQIKKVVNLWQVLRNKALSKGLDFPVNLEFARRFD